MNKLICITVIIFINQLIYCDSTLVKYKTFATSFYFPNSEIVLEKDSTFFNGFIVFEIPLLSNATFYEYTDQYIQCNIYYIEDIKNLKNDTFKIRYSPNHASYSSYAYAIETHNYTIGDSIINIDTNVNINFKKFRKFYQYYTNFRRYPEQNLFLDNMSAKIFDDDSLNFYIDEELNVYAIFNCSFYGAVLSYNSYNYQSGPKGEYKYYINNSKFFLPISNVKKLIPISSKEISNSGFTQTFISPEIHY